MAGVAGAAGLAAVIGAPGQAIANMRALAAAW